MDNMNVKAKGIESEYNMYDVLLIFGVICGIVLLGFLLYNMVKNRQTDTEQDNEDAKRNLKIALNADTNKSIINYLDTLKVVQGKDLTDLEDSLKEFITSLVNEQSDRITQNRRKIDENKQDITVNRLARRDNKDRIDKIESDIEFIRKGIKYDNTKIIMSFIREFESKYTLISNEKDMLLQTDMVYLLDDDIFRFFDKDYDKPDLFVDSNKTELMYIMHVLLRQYNFMNYYERISNIHISCYNSDVPYILKYIKMNRGSIDLQDKIDFVLNDYLPKLLNYIINNQVSIYTDLDQLMLNYYKDVPKVEFFNEYATSVDIDSVINNDTNLFTKMLITTTASLYSNWTTFKTTTFDNMFNKYEKKLLFVLLPEYLMTMKYNVDYLNKYNTFINSQYFTNIPSIFLNSENVRNFEKLLKMFTCRGKNNILNDSLKIYLSDKLSTLCTSKHQQFIDIFLKRFNDTVRRNPVLFGNVEDHIMEYKDFVCDAPEDFSINDHCSSIA